MHNQTRPWYEFSINQKDNFRKTIVNGILPSIRMNIACQLKELLDKCLQFDRKKRPNTSQLLQEPFFIEEISPSLPSDEYTNLEYSIIIKGLFN